MQAVILLGGKGVRLGALTKDIPKPLVELENKSILERQIDLLKQYGVTKIYLITGYLSEKIQKKIGDGSRFGVSVDYFIETTPLGTTGGIKEIEKKLPTDFLVIYGDIIFDMHLKRLWDYHIKKKGIATLVVHPNDHPYDSDLLELGENEEVVRFYPKPHDDNNYYPNLVNAGIYVFSPAIFKYIKKGIKEDFGKDIFPEICKKEKVFGYNTPEYIKDVGTSDRLKKVSLDIRTGKVSRWNGRNSRPAIFLDRDGTLNEDIPYIHNIDSLTLFSFTAHAIKKINQSDYLAILITNQPVVARNLCSVKELKDIHNKLETEIGKEQAKLDAIYFCPHHPDSGFPGEREELKIECNCRKPEAGLIKKAQVALNIDLKRSFIVGDSYRDILCGKNAGLKTIGVRTGKGCCDGEAQIQPDFMFDNIEKAVEFIVN